MHAARPHRALDAAPLTLTTRVLHWAVAGLVAGAFAAAWTFGALGPGWVAARLVELHRSLGLCILLATVVRIIWRLTHPLPPIPAPNWERGAAGAIQLSLYLALLLMPVLGWIGSNANGDDVAFLGVLPLPALVAADQDLGDRVFALHGWLGYVILALLGLHIAGALRHVFIKKDGVLERMIGSRS